MNALVRPTLRDVAARAGVSISTVSRVLSEHPDVSEATRSSVNSVIEEIGYRPSRLARGLITKRTESLGLVVSDIANPFYPELARGIDDAAGGEGWAVIVGNTDDDPLRTDRQLEAMLERGVDGIVFGSATGRERALAPLVEAGFPLVLVNRRHPRRRTHLIAVDNVAGGRLATEHLIGLGHRRIGHVAGPAWATNVSDRNRGYEAALRDAGLDVIPELSAEDSLGIAGGARAMTHLLALPEPPTAVFANNDMMAIGALEVADELGLAVPGDVAVIGFDDIPLAGSRLVQLSTVTHRVYEIGARAAALTIELIKGEGPSDGFVREVLAPSLVVRRTCGAEGGGR